MDGPVLSPQAGWLVIGGFSVFWVVLGWLFGRRSKSFDDHVLAGRNVGLALGTATAMATWVTSNTTWPRRSSRTSSACGGWWATRWGRRA